MKLNDFIHKKPPVKKATTQFVLENAALEQKYQDQINSLDFELGQYRTMEIERDEAVRKSGVDQEKGRLFEIENSNLLQEVTVLKTTIDNQESVLERIPVLEEEARAANGRLSNKQNEFNDLLGRSMEHSKTVSALGHQLESLESQHNQMSLDNVQFKADKISAEEERKQVLEQNEKTKIFAAETSRINIDLKKQNKELKDDLTYRENEAKDFSAQLDEAAQIETKLKVWVTRLEDEGTTNKTIKGGLDKDLISLKETATDMGNVIEGLIKENTYLRGANREFRKHLSKPRYMSMGSIARKEGFKMPQGKENIRTQYLGNGSPTLLKFKANEEDSNAR